MGLPNKIKKTIPLTFPKTLYPRREQLLEKINKDGTYLPKSILHADLDGGMLNFVKNELQVVSEGKIIPCIMRDILIDLIFVMISDISLSKFITCFCINVRLHLYTMSNFLS
jgi:hypothetical protein